MENIQNLSMTLKAEYLNYLVERRVFFYCGPDVVNGLVSDSHSISDAATVLCRLRCLRVGICSFDCLYSLSLFFLIFFALFVCLFGLHHPLFHFLV